MCVCVCVCVCCVCVFFLISYSYIKPKFTHCYVYMHKGIIAYYCVSVIVEQSIIELQCSCSKETITSLCRNRGLTVWTQDSSHSRAVWMMTTLREAVGRAASSPVPQQLLLLVASHWKTIPSTMTLFQ